MASDDVDNGGGTQCGVGVDRGITCTVVKRLVEIGVGIGGSYALVGGAVVDALAAAKEAEEDLAAIHVYLL